MPDDPPNDDSTRYVPAWFTPLSCAQCAEGAGLGFDFTMAFQPIVDVEAGRVHAYEALVRGTDGAGAGAILARVDAANRYRFDQACRVKAIRTAAALGMDTALSINFLPNAIYRPETCIRTTFEAAREAGFPTGNIIFEVTEGERVEDHDHLREIVRAYQAFGFLTAIDDFGAGWAGLNLLAEFQPDLVKIDMALTRNIHLDRVRQAIVRATVQVCDELDIDVAAEGIETVEEARCLRGFGIRLLQGYYFARPEIEQLPVPAPGALAAIA